MIRELSAAALERRWTMGIQEALIITSVPAAADPTLVGKALLGQTLTVAGAYGCILDVAAIQRLEVHLTCTVTGTAPTTSGGTTYLDQTTQKTALTGIGLMVTATRQTLSLVTANMNGERVVNVIITLPGASTAAFTQAEYNGKQ